MIIRYLRSITIGAVILTVLFWFANTLLGIQTLSTTYLWSLVSSLLTCMVFSLLIKRTSLQTKPAILFVFTTYFIIGHLNILVEAYIFDVSSRAETFRELFRGLLVAAIFSPIAFFLYQEKRSFRLLSFKRRSWIGWAWRILLANVTYLFLYSFAGFILVSVYPQLMDFYADKIPPIELIIKTQLLLRGFLFISVAIAILKFIDLPQFPRASLVGFTFAVLGGIAPLIPPNELMPGYVRFGHLFEVGISNFVFGVILGYLLGQKRIQEHESALAP